MGTIKVVMRFREQRKGATGHHISEYVLLFGLITVVSITALSSLGGNISGLISYGEPETKAQVDELYDLLNPKEETNTDLSPLAGNSLISNGIDSLDQLDGLDALGTITTSGQGFLDLADRLGSNGIGAVSETLADEMELMLLNPVLNPNQEAILRDLANQAHEIATIQRLIEEASTTATDSAGFASSLISYDGQTYNALELSKLIEFDNTGTPFESNSPITAPGAGPALSDFQATYAQAQSMGALDDPQIEAVITDHANQIGYLAEATGHRMWLYSRPDSTLSPNNYNNELRSDATDVHATGICATGRSKDTGKECKGKP